MVGKRSPLRWCGNEGGGGSEERSRGPLSRDNVTGGRTDALFLQQLLNVL